MADASFLAQRRHDRTTLLLLSTSNSGSGAIAPAPGAGAAQAPAALRPEHTEFICASRHPKALTRYEGFGNRCHSSMLMPRYWLKALTPYEGFGNFMLLQSW